MKKALFTIALVLMASSASAQFRNTTWGMSLQQVIAIEGRGDISRSDNFASMTFERVRLLDFTGRMTFTFHNGELYNAVYIMPLHSRARIHSALLQRFGRPRLSIGTKTIWEDGDTEISLNYVEALEAVFVTYSHKVRRDALRRARREADASAF